MLSSVCQRSPVFNASLTYPQSLSDNNRAREALRQCLPEPLRDATFSAALRDDAATKRCLGQLLYNLSDNAVDGSAAQTPGGSISGSIAGSAVVGSDLGNIAYK